MASRNAEHRHPPPRPMFHSVADKRMAEDEWSVVPDYPVADDGDELVNGHVLWAVGMYR